MASTSIKVEADTKRLLDELQAEVTREAGRKVTLQELTGVLARLGLEDRDRVLAAFLDRPKPVTRVQVRRLLSRKVEFPIAVAPEELDDLVYGFPAGPEHPATPGARRLRRRLRGAGWEWGPDWELRKARPRARKRRGGR